MSDTIAAISTAVGPGALSVLRLSGPDALGVCDRVFSGRERPSSAPHRHALVGEITASDGTTIDQVLLLVMRAPGTYTGEHLAEITCHGGTTAPRLVLRRLLEEGARLAEPGEFTKRAFLNGKMDLAQAEAVSDLIHAGSQKALRVAMRQLKGGLSASISAAERALVEQLALVEANIDFPEDEVEEVDRKRMACRVEEVRRGLAELASSHVRGRLVRHGIDAVIVGKPNVGKSSLFNRLVGEDRVIVSHVPGTTRDEVDAAVALDGLVINLYDTAGLGGAGVEGATGVGGGAAAATGLRVADCGRGAGAARLQRASCRPGAGVANAGREERTAPGEDSRGGYAASVGNRGLEEYPGRQQDAGAGLEAAAARKAMARLERSDIVLVVVDAAAPLDHRDAEIFEITAGRPHMTVFNKVDLDDMGEHAGGGPEVRVSALRGLGMDALREELRSMSEGLVGDVAGEMVVSERHAQCLEEATVALERAAAGLLGDLTLELISADLRTALTSLDGITGSGAAGNLLDGIFSRFCIGK